MQRRDECRVRLWTNTMESLLNEDAIAHWNLSTAETRQKDDIKYNQWNIETVVDIYNGA